MHIVGNVGIKGLPRGLQKKSAKTLPSVRIEPGTSGIADCYSLLLTNKGYLWYLTWLFFKKKFCRTWVLFVGHWYPCFGLLVMSDVSSGFQSQSGQPYLSLAEAYVLHVPWDSPLVQHLLTSWQPAWQPSCLFQIPTRHWWDLKPGAIMLPLTVWDQADALLTELSQLGCI